MLASAAGWSGPALRRPRPAGGIGASVLVSATAHVALIWFAVAAADRSPMPPESVLPTSRIELRLAAANPQTPASVPSFQMPIGSDAAPHATNPVAAAAIDIPPEQAAQRPESFLHAEAGLPDFSRSSGGVDGYLPRSELSRPPVPMGDIELQWPEGMLAVNRQVGVFWMFVDETGVVRKFEPDGPTLAPRLEEVARSVFLAARFEPAQRDGHPVKSLIRIEVVFDNRPSDSPVPTVVAERIL